MEHSLEFILELVSPIEREFPVITEKLNQISDYSSLEYRSTQREFSRMQKILDLKEEFQKLYQELLDVQSLLRTETDSDLIEMSEQEQEQIIQQLDSIGQHITFIILPPDPNDDKNVIIEMRAGAGGDESGIFIGDMFRMYSLYTQANNYKIEVMDSHEGTSGGYKEITFLISGENPYSIFKYESGVHRVQRVPKTETQGRVHTSTITVAVMPETEEVEFDIHPDEIKIEATRAQGAGGQHVNKTESAIKIYHIPTGIVVQCQDERSQHKNKDRAMKILRAKVKEKYDSERKANEDSARRSQIGSGDRAEKIRTYNFPQNRVTDHRINFTLYSLDRMMDGDVQPLLDKLTIEDKKSILEDYLKQK